MFRVISDTGIAIGLMGNDKGNSKGKKLTIQTGLPPKYLKADQNDLKEVLSGHHHFSLRIGRAPWQQFDFVVDSKDIFVMPQPLGALVSALVGKDGKPLDVGMDLFQRGLCLPSDNKMTAEEQAAYVAATKKRVGYLLDSTPLIVEHDFYSLLPRYITSNQGENRED